MQVLWKLKSRGLESWSSTALGSGRRMTKGLESKEKWDIQMRYSKIIDHWCRNNQIWGWDLSGWIRNETGSVFGGQSTWLQAFVEISILNLYRLSVGAHGRFWFSDLVAFRKSFRGRSLHWSWETRSFCSPHVSASWFTFHWTIFFIVIKVINLCFVVKVIMLIYVYDKFICLLFCHVLCQLESPRQSPRRCRSPSPSPGRRTGHGTTPTRRTRETKFFFVLLIFVKNPLNLNLQMFFVVIRPKILMI